MIAFNRRTPGLLAAVAAAGLVLASAPAQADDKGKALLDKIDAAVNAAEDQTFVHEVITTEDGEEKGRMTLKTFVKDGVRFTQFLAPGDLKGMKALAKSMSQIYVYLPAYQKVRRVTSHASKQSFMGTAISQAEQALSYYAKYYDATITAEDDDSWTLELTASADDAPYPQIELTASKEHTRPTKIVYQSEEGEPLKTETRTDYTCTEVDGVEDPVCNMKILRMVDHQSSDLTTVFSRKEWSVNDGLSDRLFSVRNLQRTR